MIYWVIGISISLGTFWLGYMVGHDRGYRNAHQNIVAQQLKQVKKKPRLKDVPPSDSMLKDVPPSDSALRTHHSALGKRKLRLVKDDDTRA